MAKVTGTVVIDVERCKGCNLCTIACPQNVLGLAPKDVNDRGYHYALMVNAPDCTGCTACATVCPDACIEVYRIVEK